MKTKRTTMAPPIMAARSRRNRRQAWVQCPLAAGLGARAATTPAALACSAAMQQPHSHLEEGTRSAVLDARIKLDEHDVQQEVDQRKDRGDQQHGGPQDRKVALADRLDGQEANARPRE